MSFVCSKDHVKFQCKETRRIENFVQRRYTCPVCGVKITTEEKVVDWYEGDGRKREREK